MQWLILLNHVTVQFDRHFFSPSLVSRTESMSLSVAEVSGLRSGSFKKSKKGTLSRTGDAAW